MLIKLLLSLSFLFASACIACSNDGSLPEIKSKKRPIQAEPASSNKKCKIAEKHTKIAGQQQLSDQYEVYKVLGKGTTATVYKAREKKTGLKVAIKTFKTKEEDSEEDGISADFLREASIFKELDGHPHIVKYPLLY